MPVVVLWVLVWFLAGIMTGFAFVGASHLNKARKAQVERQGTKLKDDHDITPEKRKPRKSKAKLLTAHKVDSEADPATLSKLTANLYKPKKSILAHSGSSAKRGASMGQATIRTRIQENHRDQDAVLVDTEARWKDHHLKRQWAQSVLLESMEPVLSKHLRHAIKSVLHFTSVGPETMDIKSTSQGIGGWESFVAPMVAPLPKVSGKSDTVTPETNGSKAPTTVVHTVLPGLSRSSSLVKPSTSQSNVAKTLEPPLPIELSSNKPPALSPSEMPSVTQEPSLPEHDTHSSQAPAPIIVRGFRSASVSRPAELTYPRPMSTAAGRAKELDKTITPVPSPGDPNTNRQTLATASKPPQVPDKDTITNSTSLPTIPDNAAIEQQQHQQQQQPSRLQSKPSRLWNKVRKAVNGGFSPSSTSISSIYQSAGGIASNLRSMSDTHLPYRSVSSTSTPSFNAAMPSFSSSVLSLLSDDQMSATERPPLNASRHPSLAFETPPETAPSSPVASSKHGRHHFLPDLARRSSTKSPAAKAELTTAESNVSHFVAARREEGRARFTDSRPESMVEELGIRLEQGLLLKSSPRSSRLSMGSTHSRSNSNRPDETRLSNEEIPLSNRNSGNINQDFDQFLTTHQGYIGLDEAPTISLQDEPKSPSPRHSAEIQRERMAALSKIEGRTESARNSLINSSEEDQRASRMLLAPSADLLNPTKEDRRKSAISFGTYFSGPSPAALRRARDQMDRSISGMETGSKGEIFHMRRTSFFDRPSSPRVESSISPSYPPSSLKTVGPSNCPSHSASIGAQLDSQKDDIQVSTSASNLLNGTDSRKKRAPLKISPLVITGVSTLPSPMVAPMSAIPRQITLDRYFFTADQVHEWNIPSYGRVKFTDHAPLVFQAVRERFQYTLQDLDEALSQPMTVMRTPGKSDAVFFVSHNHGRFLLKTLRGSEPENLRNFLSDYMAHIHKHPNTLLPRYLGMYTFEKLSGSKMTGSGPAGHHHGGSHHYRDGDRDPSSPFKAGPGRRHDSAASHHHLHLNGTLLSGKDDGLPSKVVVVVLANVFDTANLVHERYDFKGSNVGRRTLSEQPPMTTVVPPTPTTDHSIGLDIPGADLFRRHSQRNQRRQETNFNRAQNAQHDPPGSVPSEAAKEEISNLTLKEMDFQNRVNDGQTHRIHVGMAKRAEILSQLEEDTTLLRKHGFMDYSMLVGIHLVPKAAMASDVSESSAGGSQGSMGSDADNSNMDDDDDDDNGESSGEETRAMASVPDSNLQAVDRLLAVMNEKGLLSHEQTAYLKKLKAATEETILEVVEMVRGGGEVEVGEGEGDTKDPTLDSSNHLEKTSRRQRSKDPSDWGAFRTPAGTIRQNPKSDARRVRPKAVGASKGTRTLSHRRHQSRLLHRGSTSQDRSTPFKQRPRDAKRPVSPLQHKISLPMLFSTDNSNSWSQGVPSVGLPDGYEAVYYFGLIDILQKYNMFKWLERNIKGANARLLGPTTPSSSLAPPNGLSPQHPGRSTPSTSFSASSLYQLLPMASASEPSLPLAESSFPPSSTLSVLLENPASRPTSTVSLMDHHRYPLSADKRSSTGTSNMSSGSSSSHHLSHSSTQGSSSGLSVSKSATGLSSRLSQISHHSSQPSHHSGKSISMSQANDHHHHQHQGQSVLGSSPPLPVGPLSSSPQASSLQEQVQTQTQMPRHQSQPSYQAFNQHAEVSVEEPGRYAERLVDFMRGVLV